MTELGGNDRAADVRNLGGARTGWQDTPQMKAGFVAMGCPYAVGGRMPGGYAHSEPAGYAQGKEDHGVFCREDP